jgi:hypothetical protein
MPCVHLDQCAGCNAGENARFCGRLGSPGGAARTRPPLPCDPGRVAGYVTGR